MMKRIIAVLAVVVMMGVSSIAFAASDISVSGEIDIRSRNYSNLTLDKNASAVDGQQVDTQERVRLEVNVKADDVSGKIAIENDYEAFNRNERYAADGSGTNPDSGSVFLKVREAWVGFKIPDTPIGIKAGHQLLALGNGWFYRAMKYGADAWVVYTDIDKLHLGFVNVKVNEGSSGQNGDDTDFYVLVANMKMSDTMNAGVNITDAKFRAAQDPGVAEDLNLMNFGFFFNAKLGIVDLKTELDIQNGKLTAAKDTANEDVKFSGNQIVIEAKAAMDSVTINGTIARGTGQKFDETPNKVKAQVNVLDADRHYTLMYEYKIAGPAGKHAGFSGTTALNVGVQANVGKSLTVGANAWYLQATEKQTYAGAAADESTTDIGTELDANINWQITKSLSWNWDFGYFAPGKLYNKADGSKGDAATGIQGVLAFKF